MRRVGGPCGMIWGVGGAGSYGVIAGRMESSEEDFGGPNAYGVTLEGGAGRMESSGEDLG